MECGDFFFQRPFNDTLSGGEDGTVDLLTEFAFDIAREPFAINNLHVVIEVTAVVKLLGMAHRDILLLNQVLCNTLVLQDVPMFFNSAK
jgi:hypothetical protein